MGVTPAIGPAIRDQIQPREMAKGLAQGRATFGVMWEGHLLLVRLRSGNHELLEGLETAFPRERVDGALWGSPTGGYHTEVLAGLAEPSPSMAPSRFDVRALARAFGDHPHFVTPIRKREGADGLFADRVSIGRTRNKDIVLRDGSVSKFHAWFQTDAAGRFAIADAGSKNGTRVNGESIPPKELVPLNLGDRVAFGNVEAFVASPELLWDAVHLEFP